jgi:hypothetical protein
MILLLEKAAHSSINPRIRQAKLVHARLLDEIGEDVKCLSQLIITPTFVNHPSHPSLVRRLRPKTALHTNTALP